MPKPRVLLLTQWFEPEPCFKGLVFARALVARGFEVEVVTGFPNYPGGRLYPGWRLSWLKREIIDGVTVTRVPLYPSHDASAIRRFLNYVSFALSAAVYCLLAAPKADVVYVYQLPTLGVVAGLIRAFRGTPFVLDVQDLWPDSLRVTGMIDAEWALAIVTRVMRWIYRRAARLVVLSPGLRRVLTERGVAADRVEVVYNWSDEASLEAPRDADLSHFPGPERFRVLFAGNMGRAQALDVVLDAAALLRQRAPKIVFVLMGGGVERGRLENEARRRGLENVVFLAHVPIGQVGSFLQQADALFIHLGADPLFAVTIPGKTQAYMSVGKPILMAVAGDAADLVREASCGVEAAPGDAESIAGAAEKLASLTPDQRAAMGERGRSYYRQRLALAVGVERFSGIFERAATGSV